MWSTLVWSLVCLIMANDLFSPSHKSMVDALTTLPTPIPDAEYEQVIAERYLFAPFANECSAWTVLNNVSYVWQAASLPQYHSLAAEGVWLLSQTTTTSIPDTHDSASGTFQMSWMSLSDNGSLVVLSEIDVKSNASFLAVSHNVTGPIIYTAALISPDDIQLLLCDLVIATSCKVVEKISFPSSLAKTTKITAGLLVEDQGVAGWLYIAADSGLHGLDLSTLIIHPFLNDINVSVSSLALSFKRQTVFIGTETKLWIHPYGYDNEGWRFEHITGLIDAPITSLVYNEAQNKLWIGQNTGITLLSPIIMSTGRLHWLFSRLAGQISNPGSDIGHLPYANITTLSVSQSVPDNQVWLGGIQGVMRFDSNVTENNAWRVFNSARYMPNRDAFVNVTSLAVLSHAPEAPAGLGSAAVAVTSRGLAVLRFEMWTLAKKAEHFQAFLTQPERHEKYGLVATCIMSSWGDSRTCVKGPADSDALWTSMYVSSQIFRYKVTQDEAIKIAAWKNFEALDLLSQVTGILGYPARSFAKRTDFPPQRNWYPSPTYPTLQFKGDTSSDQVTGYEFIFPLVHDLLADNETERLRAYTLLLNLTNHILTHDWYLIGENHTHTRWGIWNPIQINNDSSFQVDRGLNSLQILAFLLQTYAYSGDERFLNGANLLIESYQYDVNLINQKMIAVCDINFSDDQLAYLAYFNLIHAVDRIASTTSLSTIQKTRAQLIIDNLLEYMRIGLDLSHKYKQMEKSPFYNFIYCYASGQVNQTQHLFSRLQASPFSLDCNSLSNDGVWYMQRWPLELIDWPQFNSDRLDIQLNVPAECGQVPHSLQLLPPDERTIHKWSFDVYDLDDGEGFNEEDPTAFLISYWGMRYFNLLGP